MTLYIKQYIDTFRKTPSSLSPRFFEELHEELRRFDPADFEPAVQALLVESRYNVRFAAGIGGMHTGQVQTMLDNIIRVFEHYKGKGSGAVIRCFPYVADAGLRGIVERDYVELHLKLFPSGAWKSTVIMAGSILEAILTDILTEPSRITATLASPQKPKGDIHKGEWRLEKLIDVAEDTGILPASRAKTVDQVLRDYRNFVHPQKEIRSQHECSEAEAGLAKYGLDGVCDHFERTL